MILDPSDFLPLFAYTGGIIWSYYFLWRQDYHRRSRFLILIFGALALLTAWSLFEEYWLNLEGAVAQINFLTVIILRIISLFLLLCLLFWPEKRRFRTWEEMSDYDYLAHYIHSAKLWEKRLVPCDDDTFEKGEKAYDKVWWCYLMLQKRDSKSTKLQRLLKHNNSAVRVLAARHLLWTTEKKSLEILDEEAKTQSELGKVAKSWADDWRTGKIPPDSEIVKKPETEKENLVQ